MIPARYETETIVCIRCKEAKPVPDFLFKSGRLGKTCADCKRTLHQQSAVEANAAKLADDKATHRTCKKCGETKPVVMFPRGKYVPCKSCKRRGQRVLDRERRKQLRERVAFIPPPEKYCPTCEKTLPSDAFNIQKDKDDCLNFQCRDCARWQNTVRKAQRTEKKCYGCKEVKPVACFQTDNSRHDKLSNACAECKGKRKRASREAEIARSKRRVQERKAEGLCPKCGGEALPHSQYCLHHFMKAAAARVLGSSVYGDALMKRWEQQGGACPYTGSPLTIGVNVQIDHIIPLSRGGTDTADNLQFISDWVNQMKGKFTDTEFRQAVKLIAHFTG